MEKRDSSALIENFFMNPVLFRAGLVNRSETNRRNIMAKFLHHRNSISLGSSDTRSALILNLNKKGGKNGE